MIEYYFGLDFDNCAFNDAFYKHAPTPEQRLANKSIITKNPLLVKHIESQQTENITGLIASARQDAFTDHLNGVIPRGNTSSGSCCPFMKQFCDEMGINFDKFMLADVKESEIGDTFNTIMAAIEDGTWSQYPKWKREPEMISIDEYKRTIHFAHFQYIANKNLGEKKEVVYDFFDDNYNVLGESIRFFRKNAHLIPEGMTYNVYYYNGTEAPRLLATIIGIGSPYSNYKEIVNEMMATSSGVYHRSEKLECIDKYATENLPPVEELSAQQKTIEKLNNSECYFNLTIDGAEDFLKTGKGRNNFVLRPSSLKVDGLFTFTLSVLVDPDVVQHRFAIDQKGKIYNMNSKGELSNKMDISNGIKATFEQISNDLIKTKAATNVAKDEKVAPSPRANQPRLLQPVATHISPFSMPFNKTLFTPQPEIKPQEARIPARPVELKAPVCSALLSQPQKPVVSLPGRSAGRGTSAGAFVHQPKTPTQRPVLGKPSAHPTSFFNNGQAKIQPGQGRVEKQTRPPGQDPKPHTLNTM